MSIFIVVLIFVAVVALLAWLAWRHPWQFLIDLLVAFIPV